jgi:hypothetical protein
LENCWAGKLLKIRFKSKLFIDANLNLQLPNPVFRSNTNNLDYTVYLVGYISGSFGEERGDEPDCVNSSRIRSFILLLLTRINFLQVLQFKYHWNHTAATAPESALSPSSFSP